MKSYLFDNYMNTVPSNSEFEAEWKTEGSLNRFVSSANDENKIVLADSGSYVAGVATKQDGDKIMVQSMGIVTVEAGEPLVAGDRCMPNDEGMAVKSTNNMGYRVVDVKGDMVDIIVAPNNDMLSRMQPIISEEDIEAGVTPLETGRLYVVVEGAN